MSALPESVPDRRLPALETILAGALFVFIVLGILAQANPAVHGLDRDSGFYTYIGDEILHGKLPYRDAWESKPPAVFYLNAFALWAGRGSRWGTWTLEFICLLGAAYLAFRTIRGLWGNVPALFGVVLLLYGFERTFENGNYTEEYPLALHFLAVALLLVLAREPRRRGLNLLLGIVLAVCALFRPNNAMPEAAAVIALAIVRLWERDFRALLRQMLWIALGFALPIVVTALYFWSRGLLQELLNASIVYNLSYSGTDITGASPLDVGLRAFGALILLVTAIGYVIAALRLRETDGRRAIYVFALVGLPLAVVFSDPARRTYLHYYMNWLPFLAVLGALALHAGLSKWARRAESSRAAFVAVSLLAMGAALAFFIPAGRAVDIQKAAAMFIDRGEIGIEYTPPIAVYVNKHTRADDTVLFWGAQPGLNFLSKRESPTTPLYYPLYVSSPISNILADRFLRELEDKRPALIVDMGDDRTLSLNPAERQQQIERGLGWPYMPGNIDEVWSFIDENYTPLAKVSGHAIYGLKGPA